MITSAAALPLLFAVAGCRSADVFAGPDPLAGRPPLGHDVLTLQAVIANEENMISLYRTAIGANQGGAARLRTFRSLLGQHEQHLAQLRARLVIPPGMSPSPVLSGASAAGGAAAGGAAAGATAGASGGATASASARPLPGRVSTARLRAAERASAASLVQQLGAMPPALAQLFASIAASDATHVTALGG